MNSLLFVDDDANVVRALGNIVRRSRDRWHVRFATSAAEAIEEMQRTPADVIVTDMQMPGVSGEALLVQVKRTWPATVRVLLSGDPSGSVGTHLVDLVHVSLSKPIETTLLLATLDRLCAVLEQMSSPELRQLVGAMGKLPVMSRIALDFRALLATTEPTPRAVAAIIERSPTLTARILHLGNSAFFTRARRIASIERAVTMIGFSTLHGLVMAAELFLEAEADDVYHDTLERMQARGLEAAGLVQVLTASVTTREHARTAALLHDIGLFAIIAGQRSLIDDVHERMRATGEGLVAAERALWGTTHAHVGAYLLGLWGFEWDVVHAVAGCHAAVVSGDSEDVRSVVCAASALADERYPTFSDVPDRFHLPVIEVDGDAGAARHVIWREAALLHHQDRAGRVA